MIELCSRTCTIQRAIATSAAGSTTWTAPNGSNVLLSCLSSGSCELRAAGILIQPDDVERLSPLVHHHIHLDGRYSSSLPEPLAYGQLRPLRDPNDPAEQVFDLVAASA